ncbi:MAG: protein kinase [Myxococcaceae bacterium]|nr:protein kinase [Myxococcaceae bacterium]
MSDEAMPADGPTLPSGEVGLVGSQLGSFLLTRQLGRGGMGAVYLGEHQHIGSRVAVKVLHRHLAVHPDLVARFYAEARAVNLIGHENIVNIFDMAVAQPDIYYFLMEYLEGQSLAEFARQGPLAPRVAIPMLTQVCDGLAAAHVCGVIHRDLKPENIFLTRRNGNAAFVKLLDFGIAKLFAARTDVQTRPGAIVGTPEYMAPEQATGEPVDGRIDLYAVGVIAYRLATGRLPFTATSMPSVLLMHRDVVPPEPVELEPGTGRAFSDVIMRALAKRADARFQSAQELRKALEDALAAPDESLARREPPPAPLDVQRPPPALVPPSPRVRARVTAGATGLHGSLECSEASRAGLFLCTPVTPPPLRTRLSLVLELEHEELACEAEVVRHVAEAQAREWGMSPGFALQFVRPSAEVMRALEEVRTGRPAARPAPWPLVEDDPEAERVLEGHRKRPRLDPYGFLGVLPDSGFAELRQRGRELQRELEVLRARPLSQRQVVHLEEALRRVASTLDQVDTPQRRVDVDIARGNFRGVARCLSAGLTVTALEAARAAWLQRHPAPRASVEIHLATGQAWEARGNLKTALEEYERGLAQDPAHLRLHQRYWAVLKRLETATDR